MNLQLNTLEVRVLGSLVEKQVTTPEYYPLTLNALVNACNQKSNRDPMTHLDVKEVVRTLESLREKTLATMITGPDHRVPKYAHLMDEMLDLGAPEVALLCELMVRGPQTPGELRGRASRMHPFPTNDEVESALQGLATPEGVWRPLVIKLARQPGRKESRWAHLLSGIPEEEDYPATTRPEPAVLELRSEDERFAKLEEEVAALRSEMDTIRKTLEDFRRQFE
jgi:uncharacterized protein YceH (UPF0502 family)